MKVRIGSRKSALAQAQARWVSDQLRVAFPKLEVELVLITTTGDKIPSSGLRPPSPGGRRPTAVGPLSVGEGARRAGEGSLKALFTKEIEEALLENRIDLAVHSLKDMASELPKGLVIGAIPPREDARDAWISSTRLSFSALPKGARIGTGAVRRQAQIRNLRPDLEIVPIRGNVDTRLRKLQGNGLDGIILAFAGLKRLGRQTAATEVLSTDIMLPAVGQGFLAIEVREAHAALAPFLKVLDHATSRSAALAERAFLERLGGNCQTPIAAYAHADRREFWIAGLVSSPDGVTVLRDKEGGAPKNAEATGKRLAEKLLAAGADKILQ